MARSSYIYVVTSAEYTEPPIQSAFTVKYEMLNWLTQCKSEYRVFRLSDGNDWRHRGVTDITSECQNEINGVTPTVV